MTEGDQDHHFVPCFYTKRWTSGPKRLLCEFSRPHDLVVPRRTSPKGTGYIPKLYRLEGAGVDAPNRLEEDFFRPVDTRAADALALLHEGIADAEWKPAVREAWSRFVMTLMMRMPEDIELLRESYRREFAYVTLEQELSYAARRLPGWPPTYEQALASFSAVDAADQSKELGTRLMRNARVTEKLGQMHWRAIDTAGADHHLLTSDRPVQLSGKLNGKGAQLILPIGPHRVFVAAHDKARVDAIARRGADQLVARSNRAVTEAAHRFVWSTNDAALPFVRRHFARNRPKSHLQKLVEHIEAKRARPARNERARDGRSGSRAEARHRATTRHKPTRG